MYKFTNGKVCFDEKTRDKYLKAGMYLVEESKNEIKVEDKEDANKDRYGTFKAKYSPSKK